IKIASPIELLSAAVYSARASRISREFLRDIFPFHRHLSMSSYMLRCILGSFCAFVSAKQPKAKVFCVSFWLYKLRLIVLWRIARAVCQFIFSCKCEPRNCTQFLQHVDIAGPRDQVWISIKSLAHLSRARYSTTSSSTALELCWSMRARYELYLFERINRYFFQETRRHGGDRGEGGGKCQEPRHQIILSILITAVHELAFIYDTRWSAPRHATHLTEAEEAGRKRRDFKAEVVLGPQCTCTKKRDRRRDRTHAREGDSSCLCTRLSEVFQFVLLLHRVEWLKGLLRAATVALEMGFQTQRRRRQRWRCWRYRGYKGVAEENSLYD
ncbi:unnamed protein product, partial [Trichogramma brassicae]